MASIDWQDGKILLIFSLLSDGTIGARIHQVVQYKNQLNALVNIWAYSKHEPFNAFCRVFVPVVSYPATMRLMKAVLGPTFVPAVVSYGAEIRRTTAMLGHNDVPTMINSLQKWYVHTSTNIIISWNVTVRPYAHEIESIAYDGQTVNQLLTFGT